MLNMLRVAKRGKAVNRGLVYAVVMCCGGIGKIKFVVSGITEKVTSHPSAPVGST